MAAETQHRDSDQSLRGFEAERDPGHQPDLRIHRLDPTTGEAVLDRGQERDTTSDVDYRY